MKKEKKVTKSTKPVYGIALLWIIGVVLFHMRGIESCVLLGILSVFLYKWLLKHNPDIVEEVEIPEPEPEDEEMRQFKKERDNALSEIKRLNDNIKDPVLTQKISRIETSTKKIFDYVLHNPEKKSQIRTFLNYYLPTVIKLLNAYDRMSSLDIEGENVESSKKRIEELLDMTCEAFDKQLDSLLSDSAMDINAEVKVMEQMLQQQGLR